MRAEARYWLFIWCAWIHWNVLPGEYCFVLICTHAQDIFNKQQELCLACQIANHEKCMWVCKSHSHVVCCVFVFDSYWYMFHRFQKKNEIMFFQDWWISRFFFLEGVSLPKTQRIFSFLMYYICERETYTLPEAGPDYANKGVILRKSQILMCFCNAIWCHIVLVDVCSYLLLGVRCKGWRFTALFHIGCGHLHVSWYVYWCVYRCVLFCILNVVLCILMMVLICVLILCCLYTDVQAGVGNPFTWGGVSLFITN